MIFHFKIFLLDLARPVLSDAECLRNSMKLNHHDPDWAVFEQCISLMCPYHHGLNSTLLIIPPARIPSSYSHTEAMFMLTRLSNAA